MSKFYTNIQLAGDTVLYRGYEDGQAVQFRTQFSPTLYVTSNRQEKMKTLTGKPVRPVQFESAREAREFIKTYDGVENAQKNTVNEKRTKSKKTSKSAAQ